jgi:hypothetical protein
MNTKLNSPDLDIDDNPDNADTTLIGAIAQSEADNPTNAAIVDEIEAVENEAVENLRPRRSVYEMARGAINEIERVAGGMVADRIEITACENRISAAVRDEECNEVTFSRRLEEGKTPHNVGALRGGEVNNTHNHYITITD